MQFQKDQSGKTVGSGLAIVRATPMTRLRDREDTVICAVAGADSLFLSVPLC